MALIAQIVEPFGFNSVDASLMGVFVSAFGYISSILFPVVIQKYRWYRKSMQILVAGVLLSEIFILFALNNGNRDLVLLSMGIFGFFNLPTMTVVYSYATETTYPASEVLFGSILLAGSMFFATSYSYVALYLLNLCGSSFIIGIFILFYLVSLVFAFYLKEDLRRLDMVN